jgi:hypothetical protein
MYMGIFQALKWYRKKISRRFTKEITRQQFNFPCDYGIVMAIKLMAQHLSIPIYPLGEHALQFGVGELAVVIQDKTLKKRLSRPAAT